MYIEISWSTEPGNGWIRSAMRLTNEEKETIILFNEADKTATVETFQGKIIRRMEKEGVIPVRETPEGAKKYIVPKTWIKVTPPKKMNLSDEQKQAIADRFKK